MTALSKNADHHDALVEYLLGRISMFQRVQFWLKGENIQNFGDSLTRVFLDRLFLPISESCGIIHLVGSCIDDMWVEPGLAAFAGVKPSFWGCGVRTLDGLKSSNREQIKIYAVRGPISAKMLGLEGRVPIGDSALVLPAIYRPIMLSEYRNKSICIPHFNDDRSDQEILSRSGCDLIARPNIGPELADIYRLIDIIASAKFVLSSSLHGAIAAAAYGTPFCFWDAGIPTDLPLKWDDFAASANFEGSFSKNITEGQYTYDQSIRPHIRLPKIAPLAKHAPFAVQPSAYLKLLAYDEGKEDADEVSAKELSSDLSENLAKIATSETWFREESKKQEDVEAQRTYLSQAIDRIVTTFNSRDRFQNGRIQKAQFYRKSKRDRNLIEKSGLFDEAWYRKTYADIKDKSLDTIKHYVHFGRFEGRNPSANFDTGFYLSENLDVLASGMNPLVHYIKFGKSEGRQPVSKKGPCSTCEAPVLEHNSAEVHESSSKLPRWPKKDVEDPKQNMDAWYARKPNMRLGSVRSEGGRSSISSGDGELWVEAKIRGGEKLNLSPNIETFLPMLMLIASERDVALEINAALDDAYFASLKYGFAPFICSLYGTRPPTIIRNGSKQITSVPVGASGLLFSAGVDSFYSLEKLGRELQPDFLINIHAGAHDDNRAAWKFRLENITAISEQLNIPIIEIDTNFHIHYPKAHVHCATIRNIAACLALAPTISTFYYSSAIAYEDISFKTAREHGIHFIDHAAIANILPPGIRAIELGYDASRSEKTKHIAISYLADKHLDVCTNQPYQAGKDANMPINCGRCSKCIRTIATLHHLGELDKFSGVFDLSTWNISKKKSLAVLESSHEPLDQDVLEFFKDAI
ncbi:polysaccharide pyruvyl transferase family protein [Afipia felis]|uniref:polysaccharide pyruvyl transferase family protein n=1 Tax=Afipia felis TaxID=1035 RepID=UPI0012F9A226|nr:polysaccharide pyruvyl transferase family protein [Afipia felis]